MFLVVLLGSGFRSLLPRLQSGHIQYVVRLDGLQLGLGIDE